MTENEADTLRKAAADAMAEEVARLPADLRAAITNLGEWWLSETLEFRQLVLGMLTSLAGREVGTYLEDVLEDVALPIARLPIGWQEAILITELLSALETRGDVDTAVRYLLAQEEGAEIP